MSAELIGLAVLALIGGGIFKVAKDWENIKNEQLERDRRLGEIEDRRRHEVALAEASRPQVTYMGPDALPTTAADWERRLATDVEGVKRFTQAQELRSYEIGRFTDDDDDLEDYEY